MTTIFSLPKTDPALFRFIEVQYDENVDADNHPHPPECQKTFISQSLSDYLMAIKDQISSRDQHWDTYKKYTNPYEYIHSPLPNKKYAIAKHHPLSRSYFKMLELIKTFDLLSPSQDASQDAWQTFHLAEGPGGFMEAVCHARLGARLSNPLLSASLLDDAAASTLSKKGKGYRQRNPTNRNQNNNNNQKNKNKFAEYFSSDSSSSSEDEDDKNEDKEEEQENGGEEERDSSSPLSGHNECNEDNECNAYNEDNTQTNTTPLSNIRLYGMTLLTDCHSHPGSGAGVSDGHHSAPGWKKSGSFLQMYPEVELVYGADGTGDLLSPANFDYCVERFASSMDFITADGGFDFTHNFNGQELSIVSLLWAQIRFALAMQRKGGHFVLKIFDCFHTPTIDLLYILTMFYNDVSIAKIRTSRLGNSEKYAVCRGFRFEDCSAFLPHLVTNNHNSSSAIRRFLTIDVPKHFLLCLENGNGIIGKQQIENILQTLALIDKKPKLEVLEGMVSDNLLDCIHWCTEHDVDYNVVSMERRHPFPYRRL